MIRPKPGPVTKNATPTIRYSRIHTIRFDARDFSLILKSDHVNTSEVAFRQSDPSDNRSEKSDTNRTISISIQQHEKKPTIH